MELTKLETTYKLNWNTKKIRKEEIISNQFIKFLKEVEVKNLIQKENPQIGIVKERNTINWMDKKDNEDLWSDRIQDHICENIIKDDDDYFPKCEHSDFDGGYFYMASLWEIAKGEKLIVLEYYY